jgi:kinesin family protein 18/19
VVRIRAVYENLANKRQEKLTNMKKLRQIERRIAVLSAWVAAFDTVCDAREDDDMLPSLTAIRKTT